MAAYSTLSVTTAAGTTTVQLGNENAMTIDSPGGPVGTPGAEIRTPHTFTGFAQAGPVRSDEMGHQYAGEAHKVIYPPTAHHRVSGLSYAGGVVTVTEAGTPQPWHPTWPDNPWTKTAAVPVDNASALIIDGHGVAARQTIPLNGISAISLTEAA